MKWTVFVWLLLIVGALACFQLRADMVELTDVSIGFKNFTGRTTDLLLEKIDRRPTNELSIRMNTNFFQYWYFNNEVIGRTAVDSLDKDGQFRSIAYSFQVGARVVKNLDIEYAHRSSHALDANFGFITEDSVGLRVYLFRSEFKDENTMFPWLR